MVGDDEFLREKEISENFIFWDMFKWLCMVPCILIPSLDQFSSWIVVLVG